MNETTLDIINLLRGYIGVALLLIIVVIPGGYSAPLKDFPIDSCQEIRFSGNYYLTDDIFAGSEDDPCIDIKVNNVVLDGRGNIIYGYDEGMSVIELTGNNIEIKNIELRYSEECITTYFTSTDIRIHDSIFDCYFVGLDLGPGNNFKVYNNKIVRGEDEGIWLVSVNGAQIYNNNISDIEEAAISLQESSNVLVYNNRASATYWPMYITRGSVTTIYNNYFKSLYANGIYIIEQQPILNINKQIGKNIVGGPFLGGNYYGRYDGQGFSDLCNDYNRDGFCDNRATWNGSIDYLPLTKWRPYIPPVSIKSA